MHSPELLSRIEAAEAAVLADPFDTVMLEAGGLDLAQVLEDEVLAKTWHSLVALTLGYVSPTQQGATRGTQSSLAAYQ